AGQSLLEQRLGDLDSIVDAEDVSELQAEQADVVLVGELEDLLSSCARRVRYLGAMAGHDRKVALLTNLCNFCTEIRPFLASLPQKSKFDQSLLQVLHVLPSAAT